MKIRNVATGFLFALSALSFSACENQTAKTDTAEISATTKVTDKAYVCPMHCEGSASDKPGKCPVCDMELEANKDYVAPVSASADPTQRGTITDTAAAAK